MGTGESILGNNILILRTTMGMTQEDFARIAKVSRSAVSQWETGIAEPKLSNIQAIADHFHIKKANIIEDGGMDRLSIGVGGVLYESDPEPPELTADEIELLSLYRRLDKDAKRRVLRNARNEVEDMELVAAEKRDSSA